MLKAIRAQVTFKKILIVSLLMLIVILWWIVSRITQPTEEPRERFGALPQPQTVHQSPHKQPSQIEVVVPEGPEIPQEIEVYRQQPVNLTQDDARRIAQAVGIQSEPESYTNAIIFRQDDKILSISLNGKSVSYTESLHDYLKDLNREALENYATQLLIQMFPESPLLKETTAATQYFGIIGIHETELTDQDSADFALVEVFSALNDKRIIGPLDPFGFIGMTTVSFSKQSGYTSLRTTVPGIDLSQPGIYPLRTKDMAAGELVAGNILDSIAIPQGQAYSKGGYGLPLDPTRAEFTQSEIVYYYDGNPNAFLQPMYLFTGNTSLENGTPAEIKAVLPAIDPQFLQSP
jgi:hypothetical protein